MKVFTDFVRVIKLLTQLARRVQYSRWAVVAVILSGIIGGISNTILIAALNTGMNDGKARAAGAILMYALLCLALAGARFVSSVLLIRITHAAMFDLRSQVCDQILATPLRALEKLGSHRLMAALTGDVPNITNALVTLPLLCMNLTILVGCLIYLGWLSGALLLGVIGVLILGIISHQVPVVRAVRHFILARERMDALFKYLNALIEGVKELKLNRRRSQTFFADFLKPTAISMQKETVAGETIWAAAGTWDQTLLFIVIGFVVFGAPLLVNISAMAITGYTLTILYMMGPLEFILNVIPRLEQADVSMKKIEALSVSLAERPANGEPSAPADARPQWRLLELDGVAHSYELEGEESTFILGPISLKFQPGELVFITGGNGSGKTTLAKLLSGLYAPESGEIRLDSERISEANRDMYRQLFSTVFSDFYLFEELIGLNTANLDQKAQEYLTQLQLTHKVQVTNGKLSTVDLSHGQRKRLALLTAYLEDRPIYLFDEWAADQDPHFKGLFYFEILPGLLARGKTVIAITHDDRYYHLAHRVIKLENGKLHFEEPHNRPMSVSAEVN